MRLNCVLRLITDAVSLKNVYFKTKEYGYDVPEIHNQTLVVTKGGLLMNLHEESLHYIIKSMWTALFLGYFIGMQ